jgi:hypothetical protein
VAATRESPVEAHCEGLVEAHCEVSYDDVVDHPSRRLAFMKDSIEAILGRLCALPPSPAIDELRVEAETGLREANAWSEAPPTDEERKTLIERMLNLNVEVSKLERQTSTEASAGGYPRG